MKVFMINLCSHVKCPFHNGESGCQKYENASKSCHLIKYVENFGYPAEGYGYEIASSENKTGRLAFDRYIYVNDLDPFTNCSDYYALRLIEKENIKILDSEFSNIVKHETIPKVGRGKTATVG